MVGTVVVLIQFSVGCFVHFATSRYVYMVHGRDSRGLGRIRYGTFVKPFNVTLPHILMYSLLTPLIKFYFAVLHMQVAIYMK